MEGLTESGHPQGRGDRADRTCQEATPPVSSPSTRTNPIRSRSIRRPILREGGLVAFATETVYGLGAVATESRSGRANLRGESKTGDQPGDRPCGERRTSRNNASPPGQRQRRRWQNASGLGRLRWSSTGPALIPNQVTAGLDTVGVRAPAGKVARGLIERTGHAIAAPSANRANRISPTRAAHVLADLEGASTSSSIAGPPHLASSPLCSTSPRRHHDCFGQAPSRSKSSKRHSPRTWSTLSPPYPTIDCRAPVNCRSTTRPELTLSESIQLRNWEKWVIARTSR